MKSRNEYLKYSEFVGRDLMKFTFVIAFPRNLSGPSCNSPWQVIYGYLDMSGVTAFV